ncbi:transglutaminase-like putative cysteine protease [Vogesella perlucida]|nr:transglutaminase-like putative cysteine protease [Vogesella perlucida]
MKKTLMALLLAGIYSQGSQAALKPESEAVVAVKLDKQCRWLVQKGSDCTITQQTTILKDAGRELGTYTLWVNEGDKVEMLEAYTLQADGRKLAVPSRDIQRGDVPGQNGFQGYRFIKLAYPEVAVGSTLVVRQRRQEARVAPYADLSERFVATVDAVRLDELNLRIESDKPLHWRGKNTDGLLQVAQQNEDKVLTASLARPFFLDTTETGRRFRFRLGPQLEISTEPDALRYLAPVAQAFDQRLRDALPPRAQATVDGVKGVPWQQQVATILRDVNERIRYMGDWRRSENGYIPFTLAQIEQRGFGDCKDMALTLAAMLRAAGLQAEVALVQAGVDNTPPLLTPHGYLNHAIVHLQVDGRDYWLDGTQKLNALGGVLSQLEDRPAYLLRDGSVQAATIAANDPARNRDQQQIDYTLGVDGEWRVAGSSTLEGVVARKLLSTELEEGPQALDRELADGFTYGTMKLRETKVERPALPRLFDQPYTYRATATIQNFSRPLGRFRLVDVRLLDVRLAALREYQAKEGVSDYLLETGNSDTVLRLHGVRVVSEPERCDVTSPWLDFRTEPVKVADGVGLRQQWLRKRLWVTAEELASPAFARLLDELEQCDAQSQILLQK